MSLAATTYAGFAYQPVPSYPLDYAWRRGA